ncbi:MAG: aminoglycoside phosphotransferase family protein [Marivita sp.]|uniref:phosphotransferase family protein n=1 Tax=Marivita sp. TaxID=2003365 RepID=UPI0025C2F9D1|nr:phosphotransferase [Marivita sp.]MCI5112597.1 aminoglycoside phosphotransferase family protein [Marivita sp.]
MPGFLKRYTDAHRAHEALRRTRALRRQAVPTPAARPGPDADTLVFDRVDGLTGRGLIGGTMAPLLDAVATQQDAVVPELPTYDPFLHIRPRLGLTEDPLLRGVAEGSAPTGGALLHGDLHVGQFIHAATGVVWIVDLDDLAIGPPEADLANFAAHLATTEPSLGIAGWAKQICGLWTSLGRTLEPSVFERFHHLALLRRHLKLRAAGRPDYQAEICAYLRESSSFSIR